MLGCCCGARAGALQRICFGVWREWPRGRVGPKANRLLSGVHLVSRAVKSLTEQQVDDLQAGRGMGLALPAELNGYPGPLHDIELAEQLGLSPDQLAGARGLLEAMKADAVPLGYRLVQHEAELDGLFATKAVTAVLLDDATRRIGQTCASASRANLW